MPGTSTSQNAGGGLREVPGELIEAVRAAKKPVVISHVVPDADALGSMLGFGRALRAAGVDAKASVPAGSLSQRLRFLSDMAEVPAAVPDDFAAADAFIVFDTAKKSRCNVGATVRDTDWSAGRPVLSIDHHATNTQFGDVNWVVAEASSASELAYVLALACGLSVDAASASLFYSGIQTDTLGFTLPTASSVTFRTASELAALGADIGCLGERLSRSQSKSEFDLLRVIYANTKTEADGRISYSFATHEEISGAGCSAADIDDQINVPRSLEGAEVAMLFTEGKPGKTRINFRSSGEVTIVELAGEFGGGGHNQAAGAVLDCGVREAIDRVVPRAVEYLKERFG